MFVLSFTFCLVTMCIFVVSVTFSQDFVASEIKKRNLIDCTWMLFRMLLRKKKQVYRSQFPQQFLELVSQS